MALTKEERDRLTLKALQLQQKTRQRKSVLEPYKEWIREMIEQRDMTFKILTHVLQTECGIKITEQSLNEWYRRHIGKPPRSRGTGVRGSAPAEARPARKHEEEILEIPPARVTPVAAPREKAVAHAAEPKERAAPAPPKRKLAYNSSDEWSL